MTKELFAIPVVGALIFNQHNQLFLMQSSGKFDDQWIIPGGKISHGESMEDALKREIKEETNLDIHDIQLLNVSEYIQKTKHFIFLEHVAMCILPQNVVLNEESIAYDWFTLDTALQINLAPPTKDLIILYTKQNK